MLALAHQDHGPGTADRQGPARCPSLADRVFLSALLHRLRGMCSAGSGCWYGPTVLRWRRDLLATRRAARSRPGAPAVPRTVRSSACWWCAWHGRTRAGVPSHPRRAARPRIKVAASTAWEILSQAGIDPAPERTTATWASFLRSQAGALLACDFFETVTLTGARLYVLAVIEHATRRIRMLGATPHPTASWVAQAARNLVMDLEDAGSRARFLIRDRDGKFPGLFDAILADAGIETVLSGVQMPRMNAIMERWVQTCRRELLDRTLIWNQAHLLHALREFEQSYNFHRPHQGIANARPLRASAPADPRARRRHPASRPQTGPPRRHPPRVPACRLTCTDEIFGKHTAIYQARPPELTAGDDASVGEEEIRWAIERASPAVREVARRSERPASAPAPAAASLPTTPPPPTVWPRRLTADAERATQPPPRSRWHTPWPRSRERRRDREAAQQQHRDQEHRDQGPGDSPVQLLMLIQLGTSSAGRMAFYAWVC